MSAVETLAAIRIRNGLALALQILEQNRHLKLNSYPVDVSVNRNILVNYILATAVYHYQSQLADTDYAVEFAQFDIACYHPLGLQIVHPEQQLDTRNRKLKWNQWCIERGFGNTDGFNKGKIYCNM